MACGLQDDMTLSIGILCSYAVFGLKMGTILLHVLKATSTLPPKWRSLDVIRFTLKDSWHLQWLGNSHDNNNSCLIRRKMDQKTFTDRVINMDLFFQSLQSMTITEFLKRMQKANVTGTTVPNFQTVILLFQHLGNNK